MSGWTPGSALFAFADPEVARAKVEAAGINLGEGADARAYELVALGLRYEEEEAALLFAHLERQRGKDEGGRDGAGVKSSAPPPITPLNPKPFEVEPAPRKHLTYPDDFAPSEAQVGGVDHGALDTPGARLLFYNSHLFHGALTDVMIAAGDLGCPPLFVMVPAWWGSITLEEHNHALEVAGHLAGQHEEQSEAWLTLACYVHAVVATGLARLPEWQVVPDEHRTARIAGEMMKLGACLRELELARKNRRDAATGRKLNRKAPLGGPGKRAKFAPRDRAIVRFFRERLARDPTPTVGEVAMWTVGQLEEAKGMTPAGVRGVWYRHGRNL